MSFVLLQAPTAAGQAAPASNLETYAFLIPIVAALVVFVLNTWWKLRELKQERRITRKLVVDNIKNLRERLDLERQRLKETVESFNIQNDTPPVMYIPGMYQIEVFRDMTYKEVFKAYFSARKKRFPWSKESKSEERRRHYFNRMWEYVNSLEVFKKLMNDRFQTLDDENNKFRDAYNEALTSLRKAWGDYLRKYHFISGMTESQMRFKNRLLEIISKYDSGPVNVRPYHTYNNLVRPIKRITEFDGIDADEDVVPIIEASLLGIISYANLQAFVEANAQRYTTFYEELGSMERQLLEIEMMLGK